MKIKIFALVVFLLSGCANVQSSKEENVAVSDLLAEIQIAINEINAQTDENSGLPPFKNAEIKLTTKTKTSLDGSVTFVLSANKNKSSANSSVLTLELVPNPIIPESFTKSIGHQIAEHVISAIKAVDTSKSLRLSSLTIEAGLEVIQTKVGGIEYELVGVSVKGSRSKESTGTNNLKLVFAYPTEEKAK